MIKKNPFSTNFNFLFVLFLKSLANKNGFMRFDKFSGMDNDHRLHEDV